MPGRQDTNGFLVTLALTNTRAVHGVVIVASTLRLLKRTRIKSYINNVHPDQYSQLYNVLEKVITMIVPMLDNTLVAVKNSRLLEPRIDPVNLKRREFYPDPEPGPYRSWQSRLDPKLRGFRHNADEQLPTSARVDLRKEFWDIGVQAVIQATSIDLDKDRPEYPGEDWHVQGMLILQTKLDGFKLHDPNKPGHLKTLVVHLVDPNRRIMSTSMVPCQRRDWWANEIRKEIPALWRLPPEIFDMIIGVSIIPAFLERSLTTSGEQMVPEFPISAPQAEEVRSEMLREREQLYDARTMCEPGF
ncbi:MAG: hypothetical protein Q9174_004458 [Haloplaca sp. 1 TL-2023]